MLGLGKKGRRRALLGKEGERTRKEEGGGSGGGAT